MAESLAAFADTLALLKLLSDPKKAQALLENLHAVALDSQSKIEAAASLTNEAETRDAQVTVREQTVQKSEANLAQAVAKLQSDQAALQQEQEQTHGRSEEVKRDRAIFERDSSARAKALENVAQAQMLKEEELAKRETAVSAQEAALAARLARLKEIAA